MTPPAYQGAAAAAAYTVSALCPKIAAVVIF